MQPSLLVMAAGMSSRYGSLKQLDKFGPSGETILEYAIYDAIRAGFGKVVFIIRKSIEKEFRELYDKKFSRKIAVTYVFQELDMLPAPIAVHPERTKPWGTGQAVWVARKAIQEPFAIINGDDFYGPQSFQIIADYLKAIADMASNTYCMVGYQLKNTLSEHGFVSRGICDMEENGHLQSLAEQTKIGSVDNKIMYINADNTEVALTGNEIVSMNLMGFTPTIFTFCEQLFTRFLQEHGQELKSEFYIPGVVNTLLQSKKVQMKVLSTPEKWFGVTYQEDKPLVVNQLAQLVQQGIYPNNLWA